MRQLFRSTTVYRALAESAARNEAAHFTLVLFADAKYLRAFLTECAKAFFAAEDGSRTAKLIDAESFSDCLFYPAAGGKLTAELAGGIADESLLRPVEGEKKLFVLDAFQTVTPLVQNKLLKLLEEPPEKTIFLLISEAPEMILPTILSRTQRFNIPKIEEVDIAGALQQKYGVQPRDSETIAHLANGDFIKALETIHLNEENELFFNLFVSLMRLSYQRKIREMKQWLSLIHI